MEELTENEHKYDYTLFQTLDDSTGEFYDMLQYLIHKQQVDKQIEFLDKWLEDVDRTLYSTSRCSIMKFLDEHNNEIFIDFFERRISKPNPAIQFFKNITPSERIKVFGLPFPSNRNFFNLEFYAPEETFALQTKAKLSENNISSVDDLN